MVKNKATSPLEGGKTIRDVLDKVHSWVDKPGIKSTFFWTSKLMEVVVQIDENSSPIGKGLEGLKVISKSYQHYTENVSQRNPLNEFYNKHYKNLILEHPIRIFIQSLDKKRISLKGITSKGQGSQKFMQYTTKSGKHVHWVAMGEEPDSFSSITGLYVEDPSQIQEIREEFFTELWESYNNEIEFAINEKQESLYLKQIEYDPWEYQGTQGSELVVRWKKFLEKGNRRSVILQGPPGTGKSTLARYVAKEIGGRLLYLSVEILNYGYLGFLLKVISSMEPTVIIIDDLDRLNKDRSYPLLSLFEETVNKTSLIIASTNHVENLSSALKRPGRFDEIWEVNAPTSEVIGTLVDHFAKEESLELSEEVRNKIMEISLERELPGAYIKELIRRVSALGEGELEFQKGDITFYKENIMTEDITFYKEDIPKEEDAYYEDDWDEDEDEEDWDEDEAEFMRYHFHGLGPKPKTIPWIEIKDL